MPIDDYEDVALYPLDDETREQILLDQNECTFIWGPKDHWAVGVLMTYVWREGSFWLTCTAQRKRVAAIRRDPRVSIAVSSIGTSVGPAKSITAKGRCELHDDDETKAWAYPAIAAAIMPGQEKFQELFVEMLDSERRLVFEVIPEKWITFDSAKMMAASLEAWSSKLAP